MDVIRWLVTCVIVGAPFGGPGAGQSAPEQLLAQTPTNPFQLPACPVTIANGQTPPGEQRVAGLHGNGALWTQLWPEGAIVFRPGGPGFVLADGALQMKVPWWRASRGPLTIEGRRLDTPAPPLRSLVPAGYGAEFQATALIFPTPGCWEVVGRAGTETITFVVAVVKIGSGPIQNGLP